MGCCQAGRPQRQTTTLLDLTHVQGESDSFHLMLIKGHREKDASRLMPLLDCSEPLRMKLKCKKIEKINSLVCYMLASCPDQYPFLIKSGAVQKMLALCRSDKHALSALFLMASQSDEVLQVLCDLDPLEQLLPIFEQDKQSALITSLLFGLLSALSTQVAIRIVNMGGISYALRVYGQLHHFEAKRDMLKSMFSVLKRAVTDSGMGKSAKLWEAEQEIDDSGDESLIILKRLIGSSRKDTSM